jgi:hypothetical protein
MIWWNMASTVFEGGMGIGASLAPGNDIPRVGQGVLQRLFI